MHFLPLLLLHHLLLLLLLLLLLRVPRYSFSTEITVVV